MQFLGLATTAGGLVGIGAISGAMSITGTVVGVAGITFSAGVGGYALQNQGKNYSSNDLLKNGLLTMFHGLINFGLGFAFGVSNQWETLNSNTISTSINYFVKEELMSTKNAIFNAMKFYFMNYGKATANRVMSSFLISLIWKWS